MVSHLTEEHYSLIRNFSRKVSKGRNSDDLSQHVILKLLQKDTQFINGLIDRGDEFKRFIWRFVGRMHTHDHSSYNREEYGTHHSEQRPNFIDVNALVGAKRVDKNMISHFNCVYPIYGNSNVNLKDLIKSTELTDMERMYLNAYIDNGLSFERTSTFLDIHRTTISKHVKRAIEKCKKQR